MKSGATLKVTKDFTKDFNDIVSKFKNDAVLVGIPEADNERKNEEESQDIGNAAILAINHFGSEKAGIPPRPVLTIGIRNAQEEIAEQFKKAAVNALTQGVSALDTYYERAGTIAANACKKVITDQEEIKAPSENTIAIRRAGGFHKWVESGADLGSFNYSTSKIKSVGGFAGHKALLVTGQLRNAIIYVVKGFGFK